MRDGEIVSENPQVASRENIMEVLFLMCQEVPMPIARLFRRTREAAIESWKKLFSNEDVCIFRCVDHRETKFFNETVLER